MQAPPDGLHMRLCLKSLADAATMGRLQEWGFILPGEVIR